MFLSKTLRRAFQLRKFLRHKSSLKLTKLVATLFRVAFLMELLYLNV